jgi:hypothetical protein
MIYHDGWVLILNFIKNQATNPKVQIGIEEAVKLSPIWIRNRLAIAYESLSHLIESNLIELEPNLIELESNVTESGNPKPPVPTAPKPKPDQFPIPRPDVDPALWSEWLAMRVKLKKPLTSHGYNRLIVDLGKLVAFDLNERLELAIDRKWLGLIFVEDKNGRLESNGKHQAISAKTTEYRDKRTVEAERIASGYARVAELRRIADEQDARREQGALLGDGHGIDNQIW